MAEIRSYKDLKVWQCACTLVRLAYDATRAFPREELYCLTQQIRRAVISVPSNIAEGYGRGSTNDYTRFLRTARGSLYELETQMILARDLGYLDGENQTKLANRIDECGRMLHGLITSLKR